MKISVFSLLLLFPALVFAQKKIIVLSGGGSPSGNHFSQYLQTHVLSDHLQRVSPNTDVFFAAGNRPGLSPVFADVHRKIVEDDVTKHEMSVGTIRANRQALKFNFMSYLQNEVPRTTPPGGTMFLFVSDHGMPNILPDGRPDLSFSNNCIEMWSVRRDANNQVKQMPWLERCLSRIELQQALFNQSKAARNVYVMSQCFSGGFHRMTIDLQPKEVNVINPGLCGFTAVTEDSSAAGCTPDVSGPNYQGYERYMTQQLTGRDVVTGRVVQPPRPSVRDAHEAATLEDFTVDIPLASSDFFLWKWSTLFDQPGYATRTGAAQGQSRQYFRAAFQGTIASTDKDFLRRRNIVRLMNQRIQAFDRVAGSTINSPNPEGIQNMLVRLARESDGIESQYISAVAQKERLQRNLLPAWEREVVMGNSSVLNETERAFERQLFLTWEKTSTSADQSFLWFLSLLKVSDAKRAEALGAFESQRDQRRLTWAAQHPSPDVRNAGQEIKRIETFLKQKESEIMTIKRRIGLIRRALIYRSALASWVVLEKLDDLEGLTQLKGLLDCETAKLF